MNVSDATKNFEVTVDPSEAAPARPNVGGFSTCSANLPKQLSTVAVQLAFRAKVD